MSLDNILLIRKVIGFDNTTNYEHAIKLASIMKLLNKYTNKVSLKTLNIMLLYMYKKSIQIKQPLSILEKLDIPEQLKQAYSMSLSDFSKVRNVILIDKDINYLQNIYKSSHNFYQTYVKNIPDGQRNNYDFLINKTKQIEDLEDKLFSSVKKTRYITIDSRDINHDEYESNKYRVFLKYPLKNIYSIKLISAEIPNTLYSVNTYNNIIHFQEKNTQVANNEFFKAVIPIGDYNINDLLSQIQTNMNLVGNSSYIVSLVNNKVRITSDLTGNDNIFNLQFRSNDPDKRYLDNTIGEILGFKPFYKTGLNTYTAESLYDLKQNHFVLFCLDNTSQNKNVFQKIPLNDKFVFYGSDKDYCVVHEYYPPIDLDFLDIRWVDMNNNLVNFQGLPHSFTLKIDMFV